MPPYTPAPPEPPTNLHEQRNGTNEHSQDSFVQSWLSWLMHPPFFAASGSTTAAKTIISSEETNDLPIHDFVAFFMLVLAVIYFESCMPVICSGLIKLMHEKPPNDASLYYAYPGYASPPTSLRRPLPGQSPRIRHRSNRASPPERDSRPRNHPVAFPGGRAPPPAQASPPDDFKSTRPPHEQRQIQTKQAEAQAQDYGSPWRQASLSRLLPQEDINLALTHDATGLLHVSREPSQTYAAAETTPTRAIANEKQAPQLTEPSPYFKSWHAKLRREGQSPRHRGFRFRLSAQGIYAQGRRPSIERGGCPQERDPDVPRGEQSRLRGQVKVRNLCFQNPVAPSQDDEQQPAIQSFSAMLADLQASKEAFQEGNHHVQAQLRAALQDDPLHPSLAIVQKSAGRSIKESPHTPSLAASGRYQTRSLESPHSETKVPSPWKVGPRLGGGSCGHVYLAHYIEAPDVDYAVKVSPVHKGTRRTLEAEVQNLFFLSEVNKLHHRLLYLLLPAESAHFHSMWMSPAGFVHIVMPRCLGTLRNQLGQVRGNQLRSVAAELLCGLKSLHDLSLTHGDIKPDNVLIDHDGHCLIGDFGEGFTPEYVAPELRSTMHDNPVSVYPKSPAGDYWALGVIIFESFAGSLFNFAGQSLSGISFYQIPNTNRHELNINVEQIPGLDDAYPGTSLRSFLGRLLEHDPTIRTEARGLFNHPFIQESAPNDLTVGVIDFMMTTRIEPGPFNVSLIVPSHHTDGMESPDSSMAKDLCSEIIFRGKGGEARPMPMLEDEYFQI